MTRVYESHLGFWLVIETFKYLSFILLPILLLVSIHQLFLDNEEYSKAFDSQNQENSSNLKHNSVTPSVPVLSEPLIPNKKNIPSLPEDSSATEVLFHEENLEKDTIERLPIPLPEKTAFISKEDDALPETERNGVMPETSMEPSVRSVDAYEDYINAFDNDQDKLKGPDRILKIRKRRGKRSAPIPIIAKNNGKRSKRQFLGAGHVEYKVGAYRHDLEKNIEDGKLFHFFDKIINPDGNILDLDNRKKR